MAKRERDLKKALKHQDDMMWGDIEENDFLLEHNIDEVEIAEYDLENMIYFSANTNYFRQMIRLSDSLKPVERRILYNLYQGKAFPGSKMKSNSIVGNTMKIHSHSDTAIYASLIGMAQRWKRQVPFVAGKGNFGNEKDDPNAASRYTEAGLSKYGYECFFSDYDPDCVEMLFNSSSGEDEPLSLPAKFPNILVNGGVGFAPGHAFRIPPFNVNDVIDATKKVLNNPNCGEIYLIPDLPTGCPIIDPDGTALDEMAETGKSSLRMRADIDIEEMTFNGRKMWALIVRNVPWMVSLRKIHEKLVELKRNGLLAIEEASDYSYQRKNKITGEFEMVIDYRIIVDHAHDPYAMRSKIYKMTDLDKGVSIDLKAVTEDLKVRRFTLKQLIQAWIDERRSYKRRLYNKRLTKLNARIDMLKILIRVTEKGVAPKTMKIFNESSDDDMVPRLMKLGEMNSFQATKLCDIGIRGFNKSARERYIKELPEKEKEREEVLKIIRSEKRIDQIISDELEDLRKYAQPRRSRLIKDSEIGEVISDTLHRLVITNQGYVKKLPFSKEDPRRNTILGSFANLDYPIQSMVVNNRDSVLFFDNYGRYSSIPVHTIDSCELSSPGLRNYDFTKLMGKIVTVIPHLKNSQNQSLKKAFKETYLVTLTADGYLKKTPMDDYLKVKSTRNIRAVKVREGDSLVYAGFMIGDPTVVIYTKKGKYIQTSMKAFEPSGKDTIGLQSMKLEPEDSCLGIFAVAKDTKYVAVVTEKGMVKRCEIEYFGEPSKRRGTSSYLVTLDTTDHLYGAYPLSEYGDLSIVTTQQVHNLDGEEIPIMTRKAKGSKMIPVPLGSRIIRVGVTEFVDPKKAKK